MGKRDNKITHAAHIKKHTKGTSNEISFSVLDAAKNALEGDDGSSLGSGRRFGGISLFTLPARRKKPAGTPKKEQGLPLSNGGFVSSEGKETPAPFDSLDFSTGAVRSQQPADASPVASSQPVAGESSLPPLRTRKNRAANAFAAAEAATVQPAKPKRAPEEEIARRKARRRLSRICAIAVVSCASVALLALGGIYLYHDYQHQLSNVNKLDDALSLITQADNVIIALDDVLKDPFSSEQQNALADVRFSLPDASELLSQADTQARAASLELREAKDKEAASQAVAAVSARLRLIEAGGQLLDQVEAAHTAAVQADELWKHVLAADELARTAATLVTDTTVENVQASKDKSNQAIDAFKAVSAEFQELQASYPAADFSSIASYLEKRVESLGYAVASNDAILARNKEDAAAQNDAYNRSDAEAVALAKSLPAAPSQLVYQAFEENTADEQLSYSTIRSQAGTADAFIRDYLGTDSK